MIINHTHRFIFVHIPKTGGTSVTSALKRQFEDCETIEGLHTHASARDIRRHLGREIYEAYYKFAVVRHPLQRLLSFYAFGLERAIERRERRSLGLAVKATRSAEEDAQTIENMLRLGCRKWITDFPLGVSVYGQDVKRVSQSWWFEDESASIVDDVFQMEKLEHLSQSMLGTFGIDLRIPKQNTTSRKHVDQGLLYDKALNAFVEKFHGDIAEKFAYQTPDA